MTIKYPFEKLSFAPRYRGIHEFEAEKCIACDMCAKACPVDCIYIDKSAPRKIDKKTDEKAVILGVSPDDLESHREFALDKGLPFELLVDRDSKVAGRYGVWREKNSHGRMYLGIVRSTFLIDPSGRIARIFDNLRVKGHVSKVLTALRSERDK